MYYFSSPTDSFFVYHRLIQLHQQLSPALSPPLLLDPTLFPTDFNNKNHQPISPPPVNILHPIISSHWPPPPLIPTTTLPSSGTHLHPHTLIYTHNIPTPMYIKKKILQFGPTTATSTNIHHTTTSHPGTSHRRTKILITAPLISTRTTTLPLHYLVHSSLTTTTPMNHHTPPTDTNEANPPPNTNNTLTTFNPPPAGTIAIINTHRPL